MNTSWGVNAKVNQCLTVLIWVFFRRERTDVLQGTKAAVFSKNSNFCESWTRILKLAKCVVYQKLQYSSLHVIVTDNTCTSIVERHAASNQVPLVSSEWVIQCLVNGKLLAHNSHPKYRHDLLIWGLLTLNRYGASVSLTVLS